MQMTIRWRRKPLTEMDATSQWMKRMPCKEFATLLPARLSDTTRPLPKLVNGLHWLVCRRDVASARDGGVNVDDGQIHVEVFRF